MKKFGFGKAEKLKRRKLIEELFATGKVFSSFPIKMFYRIIEDASLETFPLQAGVGVSRKNFKRAVDRNRIKRLLREAYRLQKSELLVTLRQQNLKGLVFFIFTAKELATFDIAYTAMTKCLIRLDQEAKTAHATIK